MNAVQNKLSRLVATAIVLATGGLAGCACGDSCHGNYAVESFAVWPCFGYHSTCWQPWPAECVPCPSPYLPTEVPAGEMVPAPVPGQPPMPLPTPDAAPPAEPAPAQPPADENSLNESSSRRRATASQVHYLETLRWAPADSR